MELARIFRDEAIENLDGMVACLLAVEAGQASAATTDALFRHAHSIKGSAGMVGMQEAGAIANAIEDVLAGARAAGALSPLQVGPLLAATDALRRAVAGERGVAPAALRVLAGEAEGGGEIALDDERGAANVSRVGETQRDVASATIRVASHKVRPHARCDRRDSSASPASGAHARRRRSASRRSRRAGGGPRRAPARRAAGDGARSAHGAAELDHQPAATSRARPCPRRRQAG